MQAHYVWFVAAFLMVGAELLAGTFYLLVVGVGLAAGGLAAMLGLPQGGQIAVAALIAVVGIVVLRRTRAGNLLRAGKPDVPMDVGQPVQVIEQRSDGSLRVSYRGTQWDAELESPLPEGLGGTSGTMYIRALRGTRLIVASQPA
jgi:membrane protein implicated in regulation of membrane protease activity